MLYYAGSALTPGLSMQILHPQKYSSRVLPQGRGEERCREARRERRERGKEGNKVLGVQLYIPSADQKREAWNEVGQEKVHSTQRSCSRQRDGHFQMHTVTSSTRQPLVAPPHSRNSIYHLPRTIERLLNVSQFNYPSGRILDPILHYTGSKSLGPLNRNNQRYSVSFCWISFSRLVAGSYDRPGTSVLRKLAC